MNGNADDLNVHIVYKKLEQTFSGTPEDVWISINKFFNNILPTFEIAEKLVLDVDLQSLAAQCEQIIAFSPEGPNLLVPRDKMTDNETLGLLLLAAYLGSKLGKTQKNSVSKDALQMKLGKEMKITSTRLGEMIKADTVMKTETDEYKLTTYGVTQMQKDILPRIKEKARG